MYDLIINPFITALTFLYQLLGNNIVLAIVAFTILIRLALSPLFLYQQRTSRKMQEQQQILQPKLKELQKKYKNDREKLSQAQMELYRENGQNPLAGCVPLIFVLVVQLPLLSAMYSVITRALGESPYQLIDLPQRLLLPSLDHLVPLDNTFLGMNLALAPTANPLYALALPLLVLVTTWLQSKLTLPAPPPPTLNEDGQPSQADQAAQMTRTMTTFMPLMFGFFSLSFSVGLSIYFVVSNLVGIAQYSLTGKAEWGRLLGRAPKPKPELIAGGEKHKNEQPAVLMTEKVKKVQTVPNGVAKKPLPAKSSGSKKSGSSKAK